MVALLFGIGVCVIWILWPVHWIFGLSPGKLLDDYVEASPPASLTKIYRNGAIYLQRHFDSNEQRLNLLSWVFRVGSVLLIVETALMTVMLLWR